jgi:hypothetical protein
LNAVARQFARPELISHGRPQAATAIRKVIATARMKVQDGHCGTACPAAEMKAEEHGRYGMVVRCAVERNLITEVGDPSTLANRCLMDGEDGYQACTTWRSEKERIWAARKPLVSEYEGVR